MSDDSRSASPITTSRSAPTAPAPHRQRRLISCSSSCRPGESWRVRNPFARSTPSGIASRHRSSALRSNGSAAPSVKVVNSASVDPPPASAASRAAPGWTRSKTMAGGIAQSTVRRICARGARRASPCRGRLRFGRRDEIGLVQQQDVGGRDLAPQQMLEPGRCRLGRVDDGQDAIQPDPRHRYRHMRERPGVGDAAGHEENEVRRRAARSPRSAPAPRRRPGCSRRIHSPAPACRPTPARSAPRRCRGDLQAVLGGQQPAHQCIACAHGLFAVAKVPIRSVMSCALAASGITVSVAIPAAPRV